MDSAPPAPPILHLTMITGTPLRDGDGAPLGKVNDLIVRLGDVGYPPITGYLVTVARRSSFLPVERVAHMGTDGVTLDKAKLDLRPFHRRPGEVLLRRDVLDRQLINVDGARLVRANEIELAHVTGEWRVVGVDTGARGGLRRLLPRVLGRRIQTGGFLDWASVEPFVGHVPTVRLSVSHPKLAKLHPAQIADLVEAASHSEGEEIIRALGEGDDRELEADVYEELDDQHQVEFIEDRSDAEVARVLTHMEADDAADLLAEFDDERREAMLALLPARERTKIRSLLGYDAAEAGGLMSPDFILLSAELTADDALREIRRSDLPHELLGAVFVYGEDGEVDAGVPTVELIRCAPQATLGSLVEHDLPRLAPDAPFEEVARLMADFNLTAAPVVLDGRMVGAITVDDVLEAMLPKGWRRRFGLLGED
ncbi:MAG TPA: CBS domain-containing protein [Solirubrobacteraceae bacterium]|jgi:hypothetical protein|nr:CBS domain-containing protein [Solirubrobacteraceae bacterium]